MLGTMRLDGHTALVHTAAASNLGQMLNKLCLKEDVALVNIVRKPEQEHLLRELGARWVCNSTSADFMAQLIAAVQETGATLAFDAIGGGLIASQILTAMEVAAAAKTPGLTRYGSTVNKQVYIYGGLDRSPTTLNRSYGMKWNVGGWLMGHFLERVGPSEAEQLRQRVAREIKTTFASRYTREVSLAEMVQPEAIASYAKQATGEKYLVCPQRVS
jgi:NADPH2:quinone reductase